MCDYEGECEVCEIHIIQAEESGGTIQPNIDYILALL